MINDLFYKNIDFKNNYYVSIVYTKLSLMNNVIENLSIILFKYIYLYLSCLIVNYHVK